MSDSMSLSYSTASSPMEEDDYGDGSMANGEFEVAKVLANLGRNMADESNGGDTVDGLWGSKGRRSSNRVKDYHNAPTPELNSLPLPFDLNVDQAALYQEECENGCQESIEVKVEEVCESAEPDPIGKAKHNGNRLRQNLTEAEKEARRIRRILANRESARQTIRRRQAMYEELTRKAVELASENEDLKKSKELVVKEYQSLQTTNNNLKEKISQTLGFDRGKKENEANSANTDTRIHPAKWPRFMCSEMLSSPFIFPAHMQPSEVDISQISEHALAFSSKAVATTHNNPCLLHEQETNLNLSNQNMPWCILPYPWFFPMSNTIKDSSVYQLASSDLKDKDEDTSINTKHVYSRSSVIPCLRNCSPFAAYGGSQHHTSQLKRVAYASAPLCPPTTAGHPLDQEECSFPHPLPTLEAPSAKSVHNAGNSAQLGKHHVSSPSRQKVDNVAGAEARNRRRELIKLKGLHGHHLSKRAYGS